MRQSLLETQATKFYSSEDPSHDRGHIQRVRKNCQIISEVEGGDHDILYPAALLHDCINIAKNDPRAYMATDLSATTARDILLSLSEYPQEKISAVEYAIKHCSFSKNLPHDTLESKILQDADYLESVGAISLMRTFSSGGVMKKTFFHPTDPRCESREADPKSFSFDLIESRLLKVQERMCTEIGKALAQQRSEFLQTFVHQVKRELGM